MSGSAEETAGRCGWKRRSRALWEVDLDRLPPWRRCFVVAARLVLLVVERFHKDDIRLHASALTYYSLMAIVPVLALALALARVFGGAELARQRIRLEIVSWGEQLTTGGLNPQPADVTLVQDFVSRLTHLSDQLFDRIAQLSFGTLGGIGLVLLIWTAIGMLSQIEGSFNRVWGVSGRTLWRRFADYLSVIIVVPFLILAASTIPVADLLAQRLDGLAAAGAALVWLPSALRRLAVLALTTAIFVFILMFLPNAHVRLKAGLAGGFCTALLFTGWLRVCAALQVGVINSSKLYGGLAAVPILLAWSYISWQIVLLGAEIAFAVQHVGTYGRERDASEASMRSRRLLALGVVAEMARAMRDGTAPFVPEHFARGQRISVRLLHEVIESLRVAGLVAEAAQEGGGFLLTRDPARLLVREVVRAIDDQGNGPEALGLVALEPRVRAALAAAEAVWLGALEQPVGALPALPEERPISA